MNPNIEQWVEALRSGQYTQTLTRLRYKDTYCCLGVACDLYNKDTQKGIWLKRTVNQDVYTFNIGSKIVEYVLPIPVREWLGISSQHARIYGFMNDTGRDFDQIANRIEEDYNEGKE